MDLTDDKVFFRKFVAGRTSQQWLFTVEPSGCYSIRNAATGQLIVGMQRSLATQAGSDQLSPWNTWVRADNSTLRPVDRSESSKLWGVGD